MKKFIAMMCAALFLFGGTYALASTTSVSEPQTMTKSKKKDRSGEKTTTTDKKNDTKKDSSKDKNDKSGNKKDNSKSDTSKK